MESKKGALPEILPYLVIFIILFVVIIAIIYAIYTGGLEFILPGVDVVKGKFE